MKYGSGVKKLHKVERNCMQAQGPREGAGDSATLYHKIKKWSNFHKAFSCYVQYLYAFSQENAYTQIMQKYWPNIVRHGVHQRRFYRYCGIVRDVDQYWIFNLETLENSMPLKKRDIFLTFSFLYNYGQYRKIIYPEARRENSQKLSAHADRGRLFPS